MNIAPTLELVAPDIHRLRLPLPFALDHVNCYLLRGEGGWTLLDTGLHTPEGWQGWLAAFDQLGIEPGDVEQIVLTHVHPDHYGMAGALQAWTGNAAPVRMSVATDQAAEAIWRSPAESWLDETSAYLRCNGLEASFLESVLQSMRGMRAAVRPHPERVEIFASGDGLSLGNRHFRAISAQGHADDQCVFYDEADRLLLCGDQVLMRITPNVGSWPTTPANPLGRFLADLRHLRRLDVGLALPGHRREIEDFAGRIDELLAHHQKRLNAIRQAIPADGASTLEIARRVFPMESFTPHEIRFAVAETLAHLEHLLEEGQVVQEEREGTWLFLPRL
ncbi:MAG: MBL fold metallo-hydrolase [Caldilineaceae bacterium]|nr:MBL fold metallo-hydrolase [Caldilineaceae bacterium]HRJ42376.1 MBL fold metallo-hydrolase [Caldilineaceae bacterium]